MKFGDISFLVSLGKFGVFLYKGGKFYSTKESSSGAYGVSWNDDCLFYSYQHKFVIQLNIQNEKVKVSSFDGIHQIYANNEVCLVCRSISDTFSVIELSNNTAYDKKFRTPTTNTNARKDKSDGTHINSVFFYEDMYYIMHHNYDNPSFISVVDKNLNTVDRILDVGSQNHNIYIDEDGTLYTLSSKENVLKIFKDKKEIHRKTVKTNKDIGYPRGLDFGENFILIGSTPKGHDIDSRDGKQSAVYLYDKNTLEITDEMMIPCPGQVRDIKLLDSTKSHNKITKKSEDIIHLFKKFVG